VELKINVNKPKIPTSSCLYGAFFEEINSAGDGGLYAEMIQNRAFEDSLVPQGCRVRGNTLISPTERESFFPADDPVPAWSLIGDEVAAVRMALDSTKPLNKKRAQSLKVDIINPGDKGTGVYNYGYRERRLRLADYRIV
jgi:hypothetical protein